MTPTDMPQALADFIFYLEIVKNRSKLTVLNYYTDLRTFMRYIKYNQGLVPSNADFKEITISDITDEQIKAVDLKFVQEYLVWLSRERDNDPKARYRKAVSLRQFYKYLTNNRGMFEVNPLSNLELPSPKNALPKYLTLEQALELLKSIDTPSQKRDYCIVVFFLNCGMRLSELVGINLKDIRATKNKDGAEVYTLRVLGKGSKERIIYLNNACVSAYKDYLDYNKDKNDGRNPEVKEEALFLSKQNKRISNRRVEQIIENCLKASGLDGMGLSVHKLRHTAATLMYHNGVDVRVLKDVLGHENLNTTQIYTHVVSSQLEEAMKNNPLSNVEIKPKDKK